jgi:hypothetical protein
MNILDHYILSLSGVLKFRVIVEKFAGATVAKYTIFAQKF